MHLFGLTGGIAAGKSAVAARLRARKVPIVDADVLAREVVTPRTPTGDAVLAEIVAAFGAGVLAADGSLDRPALGKVIFGDDAKRRALNAIIHPRITAATLAQAAAFGERGEPLVCYDAALIVENGFADMVRPLVVVAAPEPLQIARIRARDGLDEAAALARIRAQMPLERKIAVADIVIDNAGTLAELEQKSDQALDEVCRRTGVDPARYPKESATIPPT